MHLVIPFAAPLAEAGRAALKGLAWPVLSRQLAALGEPLHDAGDEWSLTPPHERAIAAAAGWPIADGLFPAAALAAAADGIDAGGAPLALLTPAHWHLGTEQLGMADPAALQLDADESRRTLELLAPLFADEGFVLHWGAPLRWYAAHPSFATLPTASLDRVIGRNVDAWLGAGAGLGLLRRLQSEVQMLLHQHPLNEGREARGLPALNSVWFSGTGTPPPRHAPLPRIDARLRDAALAEDWAAWAAGWAQLDADLEASGWQRLTLCGERGALTWQRGTARPWWQAAAARWRGVGLAALLERL